MLQEDFLDNALSKINVANLSVATFLEPILKGLSIQEKDSILKTEIQELLFDREIRINPICNHWIKGTNVPGFKSIYLDKNKPEKDFGWFYLSSVDENNMFLKLDTKQKISRTIKNIAHIRTIYLLTKFEYLKAYPTYPKKAEPISIRTPNGNVYAAQQQIDPYKEVSLADKENTIQAYAYNIAKNFFDDNFKIYKCKNEYRQIADEIFFEVLTSAGSMINDPELKSSMINKINLGFSEIKENKIDYTERSR